MVRALRYRTGINRETGELLVGFPHVQQSLAVIWLTKLLDRFMLLDFGSNLRGHLSEDLTPELALDIYDSLISSAHKYEPEFRISSLQFVRLNATGLLALRYSGVYFPEGRFGNYDDREEINTPQILSNGNISLFSGRAV